MKLFCRIKKSLFGFMEASFRFFKFFMLKYTNKMEAYNPTSIIMGDTVVNAIYGRRI